MVQAHDFRWKKLVGKMVLSEAPGVQRTSRTNKYSTTSSPVMSGFEALACHACSSGRRCHKSKEFTTLATKETIAIETAFHTVIDIIVFFQFAVCFDICCTSLWCVDLNGWDFTTYSQGGSLSSSQRIVVRVLSSILQISTAKVPRFSPKCSPEWWTCQESTATIHLFNLFI